MDRAGLQAATLWLCSTLESRWTPVSSGPLLLTLNTLHNHVCSETRERCVCTCCRTRLAEVKRSRCSLIIFVETSQISWSGKPWMGYTWQDTDSVCSCANCTTCSQVCFLLCLIRSFIVLILKTHVGQSEAWIQLPWRLSNQNVTGLVSDINASTCYATSKQQLVNTCRCFVGQPALTQQ